MRKLFEVFRLELRSLVRSRAAAMLLVAGVAWMLLFPRLVRGDGTAESARELYVHFSLGGVFFLLVVALLASATGSLARERAAKRLQLAMVRPVGYLSIVLGKLAAHVAVGAAVLAAACATMALTVDLGVPCSHVLAPILPSPRAEAEAAYERCLKDPRTPEAIRRASKSVVLRLLENRELDRYQTVATNAVTAWMFPIDPAVAERASGLAVRMRFAAQYDMRQEVYGAFALGPFEGLVSNVTQAVLTAPLRLVRDSSASRASRTLAFENRGKNALMLRPRRDIHVLVPADGFGWNLLRAYVVLMSVLAAVVAFGLFLSAGLGRPVALFVAFVTLIVGEMGPSVVEQYPDELETKLGDRIGLVMTRAAVAVTRPFSSTSPLEELSRDERVEPERVWSQVGLNGLAIPLLLAALAALALPRKQDY